FFQRELAQARLFARDFAGAEKAARRSVELDATEPDAFRLIAEAAGGRGDKTAKDEATAARRALEEGRERVRALLREKKAETVGLLEEVTRLVPRESALW